MREDVLFFLSKNILYKNKFKCIEYFLRTTFTAMTINFPAKTSSTITHSGECTQATHSALLGSPPNLDGIIVLSQTKHSRNWSALVTTLISSLKKTCQKTACQAILYKSGFIFLHRLIALFCRIPCVFYFYFFILILCFYT